MDAFTNVLKGTPLKNQLIDKSTGAVNMTAAFNTPSFNLGKITGLGDSLGRSLKGFNILNQSSDIFNFINNTKNVEDNMFQFILNCNNELKDLGVIK